MKAGMCVSCGRVPGRYWICPYCGERVWWPRWVAVLYLAVAPGGALLACVALWLSAPGWRMVTNAWRDASPLAAALFAAGWGMLLLPVPNEDLILSSRSQAVRCQIASLACGVLCAAMGLMVATALFYGETACGVVWLSAVPGMGCVLAMPYLYRLPRCTPTAGLMLIAALALTRAGEGLVTR